MWDAHGAQKADSTANWLPGGVCVGCCVSEAMEAFVTTFPRMSGARDDLRKPFPFNGGRDPVVVRLLTFEFVHIARGRTTSISRGSMERIAMPRHSFAGNKAQAAHHRGSVAKENFVSRS
jgi:hypothetical protein